MREKNAKAEGRGGRQLASQAGEGTVQFSFGLTPLRRKENSYGPVPCLLPPGEALRIGRVPEARSTVQEAHNPLPWWLLQHCAFTRTLHRALHLENCFPGLDPFISLSGERK